MEIKELERAIESILFASGEPVGVERLCLALDQDRDTVDAVCQRLADHYRYERRGMRLRMGSIHPMQLCRKGRHSPTEQCLRVGSGRPRLPGRCPKVRREM